MAEKKTFDPGQFRALLKKAIGEHRTQAEFASETGISTEHISRMLNSVNANRPGRKTLSKIAGHASGGVTYPMLLESCGYGREDAPAPAIIERKTLCPVERTKKCIEDIMQGLSELAGKKTMFNSSYDYIDLCNTLYAIEDISYSLEEPVDITSDARPFAEKACLCTASFTDKEFTSEFWFVIFFAETKKGSVIITGAPGWDDRAFKELEDQNPDVFDIIYKADELELDSKGKVFCNIFSKLPAPKKTPEELERAFKAKVKEIMELRGMSEKEAMFEAMFPHTKAKRIATVEGMGFYLDKTPEYAVKKFIENHKETFCISAKEIKIVERMEEDEPLDKVFGGYTCSYPRTGVNHWGCAVANIITRETGINVSLWNDFYDSYEYPNRPSVMFDYSEPWHYNDYEKELTEETLREILDKYAVELRTEVKNTYFVMSLPKED